MCGIRGTVSLLKNSYLSNRDQYVVCDDYKSDVFFLPVNVGDLQGSVSTGILKLELSCLFFVKICNMHFFSEYKLSLSRIRDDS